LLVEYYHRLPSKQAAKLLYFEADNNRTEFPQKLLMAQDDAVSASDNRKECLPLDQDLEND